MRRYSILSVLIISIMLVSACSGGDGGYASRLSSARYEHVVEPASMDFAAWDGGAELTLQRAVSNIPSEPLESHAPQRARHIIQTAWTQLETRYFDNVIEDLRQLPQVYGGYVETEQLNNHNRRAFTMTMRVPTAYFHDVLHRIESLADVISSRQRSEDVTDQFYDIQGRLETRLIEEERLLALIAGATDVRDILNLESRLSDTRLQIRTYETQINSLAGRIAYSTINITLNDVVVVDTIANATISGRISNAFSDSLESTISTTQNFLIFISGIIVPLAVWSIIIFVIVKFVLRLRKKYNNLQV